MQYRQRTYSYLDGIGVPDKRYLLVPVGSLYHLSDKDRPVFGIGSGDEGAIWRPADASTAITTRGPIIHRGPTYLRRRKKVAMPDSANGFDTVCTHCHVWVLQILTVLSSD